MKRIKGVQEEDYSMSHDVGAGKRMVSEGEAREGNC
jgi:hypothetical protein